MAVPESEGSPFNLSVCLLEFLSPEGRCNTCATLQTAPFLEYQSLLSDDVRGTAQDNLSAFLVDGGAVSWSSKRQEIVVLSTTEAEYVAATHAAKEALWLRTFVSEVFGPISNPTTLYFDNQSMIALSKHIDIHFHYIRWIIDEGKLKLISALLTR
jgi:hypothetical protein